MIFLHTTLFYHTPFSNTTNHPPPKPSVTKYLLMAENTSHPFLTKRSLSVIIFHHHSLPFHKKKPEQCSGFGLSKKIYFLHRRVCICDPFPLMTLLKGRVAGAACLDAGAPLAGLLRRGAAPAACGRLPVYSPVTVSQKRCRIVAACALVALPFGIRLLSLPWIRPAPLAHCIAGTAHSLTVSASA